MTDVMPETHVKSSIVTPELHLQSVDNNFLLFCKRFRLAMRSLIFVQYFTVVELIRLKLVHPQLNQIINKETINMAIQIGNLDSKERELYWQAFASYSIEEIYQRLPSSTVDLIKKSNDSTMFIIKNTLRNHVKHGVVHNEDLITKIISHLFIHNKLNRIYDVLQTPSSSAAQSKYGVSVDMMVFTLETLIKEHLGISFKDANKTLHE